MGCLAILRNMLFFFNRTAKMHTCVYWVHGLKEEPNVYSKAQVMMSDDAGKHPRLKFKIIH